MIDNKVKVELQSRIEELYDSGLSYRDIGKMTNVAHTTIENIHKGLKDPTLETVVKISTGLKMDTHKIAHQAFGLASPAGEMDPSEIVRKINELIRKLNDNEKEFILSILKTHIEQGWMGGDTFAKPLDAKSGHG